MHELEPHYNWRHLYQSETDVRSPFFEREYNELGYDTTIYGYYIHPQWDSLGSSTLYVKVLYVDYDRGAAIIELIGEWNDLLHNDIMHFKRELIDELIYQGIYRFILIGEFVMNFHYSEEDYYEEWFDELQDYDGYIALLNFREHVLQEMNEGNIDNFLLLGGRLNDMTWRTNEPGVLISKVDDLIQKRLGAGSIL